MALTSHSPPPKISVSGLGRTFRARGVRTEALREVNLDIRPGEFVCLLGESGCGKSTLLHLIAGLDRPSSGTLRVDGQPVHGTGRDRTMVFQSPLLFPWLTVAENIRLGLDIRGGSNSSEARVQELITLVGLEGFGQALPRELSGGMAQRVALARALAPEPSVLLLDEPYSALDMFTRLRLQEELLRIWQDRQITTVFVTHDIEEAVFLASKVVILTSRPGRIARIIHNSLPYPRVRDDAESHRMRQMISQEFAILREEQLAAEAKKETQSHVL